MNKAEMKLAEQENINKEIEAMKETLKQNRMNIDICRKISKLTDRQIALTNRKNLQPIYTQIGLYLGLDQVDAVKDIRSIVNAYDNLKKSDINIQCIDKIFQTGSLSWSRKLICALNYIRPTDKRRYLNGQVNMSQFYECRKSCPVVCANQTLEERAKRLKDDSEIPLTVDMIMGTFQGATNNYLESILMYTDMVSQVKEKAHDSGDLIPQIVIAMEMVNQAITSFKEAIINNSIN